MGVYSGFFLRAKDRIRDPLWSRGLGDVYKGQGRYNEAGRKVMVGHVLREERQKMLLHLAGLEQELRGNSGTARTGLP